MIAPRSAPARTDAAALRVARDLRRDEAAAVAEALPLLALTAVNRRVPILATELSRYVVRTAFRLDPGVPRVFHALRLDGDLGAISTSLERQIRSSLVAHPPSIEGFGMLTQRADWQLLRSASREVSRALRDAAVAARIHAPARRDRSVPIRVFRHANPVRALQDDLRRLDG